MTKMLRLSNFPGRYRCSCSKKLKSLQSFFRATVLSILPAPFNANFITFDAVYIWIVTLKVNGKMMVR